MPKKALAVYRSLSGPKARRILILKLLPWHSTAQHSTTQNAERIAQSTEHRAQHTQNFKHPTLRKASARGQALITSVEVLEWQGARGRPAPTTSQPHRTKTTIPFGKRLL